ATFHAFPKDADFDLRRAEDVFPELSTIPPGLKLSQFYMERAFIDPIPAQYDGLKQALATFPADVILGDDAFLGALPLLLDSRERVPVVLCGTMFLHYRRDDSAPHFVGLPPATSEAEREAYAAMAKQHDALLYVHVRKYLNRCLANLGVK